jgi:nucleoside-diphosphate-sugar epimerase
MRVLITGAEGFLGAAATAALSAARFDVRPVTGPGRVGAIECDLADQIVEPSPELGPVRSFRAGLEACR